MAPVDFVQRLRSNAFSDLDVSSHELDLQGWVQPGFEESLRVVADALAGARDSASPRRDLTVFEIGTWKGASACKIADALKGRLRSLVCVDTWLGAPEFYTTFIDEPCRFANDHVHGWPQTYHTFIKNVKALGHDDVVVPFPISSAQAAVVLRFYDIRAHAIYVDASHEYDAVLADLEAFRDLVLPGGIMWGDDYGHPLFPGLAKAVDEFAARHGYGVEVRGINWMIRM